MDRLLSCYDCMDCRSRVVRFCFPNEEELVWEGYSSSSPNPLISNLKANKMMSKRLLCHLVSVNDLYNDILFIDSVHVVNDFQDVFPDDLPGVPPRREIDFGIDLEPDTKPISIPPYEMAPAELKELKLQLQDLTDKGFIQPNNIPLGHSSVVSEKRKMEPLECVSIIGSSKKLLSRISMHFPK